MTSDLQEAVTGVDVILLTVPIATLGYYAARLSSILAEDQIVILNPGHTCGGLYFATALRKAGFQGTVQLGEFHTLSYGARVVAPARVNIIHITRNLLFSSFPGKLQDQLYPRVKQMYPEAIKAKNVLQSALHCINQMEHPPQIILNAGWVEHTKGDYLFYYEGTTPSVGRVIDALDTERLRLAEALGVETKPFVDLFYESGYTTKAGHESGSAYGALQESPPNRWVKGPKSLDTRYIHEDVGFGLVPMAHLARLVGVSTPVMDALITLASTLNGVDYMSEGLTLEKMGLCGKKKEELEDFLFEGYR